METGTGSGGERGDDFVCVIKKIKNFSFTLYNVTYHSYASSLSLFSSF